MPTRETVLKSLFDLSEQFVTGTRPELLDRLLHTALAICDCDGATVLVAHHRVCERVTLCRGDAQSATLEFPRGASEITRTLLRGGHPVTIQDLANDPMVKGDDLCAGVDAGPALLVPLRFREHPFGYFAIYRNRQRERFTSEEARLASLLASWAAMALQNLRLSESLKKLAVTDDLTQVYNFRFLKTALRREIKRAGRFNQSLALVMIDVDNLKSYNDRNGHMRGSLLLRELAGLFAQQVRSFDLVAKYGGDEFTVILPQTDREGAIVVADRLRAVVAEHTFPLTVRGAITVSIGVALFPEDANDSIGLIQASDRALYTAKQRGRNRVETLGQRAA